MTVSAIACKVVLHASLQWMPTFGVVEMGIERIPAEGSDENRRETFFRHAGVVRAVGPVSGRINVYGGVTTKSERHERSYWTRMAAGNGIGGRRSAGAMRFLIDS